MFSVEKGTLVTRGMFESVERVLAEMKEPVVAGLKAEDLYQVVGGILRPGDRIHIYLLGQDGEIRLLRDDVYVQQTFDTHGNPVEPGDGVTAVYRLNVYMEKRDVDEFYGDLSTGTLRIVKASG
ncbi:MAG: hypothetical protein IJ335_09150 [Lachnospiraceae bacterium]|nr:hypothetical protein [Lachnospiraceae bacterium]